MAASTIKCHPPMSSLIFFGHKPRVVLTKTTEPIFLLQSLVTPVGEAAEGVIISVSAIPWIAIAEECARDPEAIFQFSKNPRLFEEFLAGAYRLAGWDEVILTPRSGDGGRDVIATRFGYCTVRILDQAKAYAPNHLVNADDVRAMIGTLNAFDNSSKGIITTTSDFAPGIKSAPELTKFMPHRLDLKNGNDLKNWISQLGSAPFA